jgi:hypothetical protein
MSDHKGPGSETSLCRAVACGRQSVLYMQRQSGDGALIGCHTQAPGGTVAPKSSGKCVESLKIVWKERDQV